MNSSHPAPSSSHRTWPNLVSFATIPGRELIADQTFGKKGWKGGREEGRVAGENLMGRELRNQDGWEWVISILVFYCCLTNSHKLGGFTQHTFIVSQLLYVRNMPRHSWVLCSGSHKVAIKVLTGLHFIRGSTGERLTSKHPQTAGRLVSNL